MAGLNPPPQSGISPGKTSDAETFAESSLSTTLTDATVAGESIKIGTTIGESIDTSGGGSSNADQTGEAGFIVNPNRGDLRGFRVTLADATGGNSGTVELVRDSDGTVLASETGDFSGGETVTVDAGSTLSDGSAYRLTFDNDGNTYTAVQFFNTFTISGSEFDVTNGWDSGATANNGYNFPEITAIRKAPSATAYLSWPMPPDLRDWDRAMYLASKDGETVEVYVEEDQSGGWTEIVGPVASGDPIPASPSNNVRFRVEFSRANLSNDPRLDAIYRRWIIE